MALPQPLRRQPDVRGLVHADLRPRRPRRLERTRTRSTGAPAEEAKKKEESSDGKSPDGKSEKKPSSTDGTAKEEKKPEPAFQFGLINILLIFGAGAIGCLKLGFFDGENVPDFVAKRDDLEYYFKTLAPPEMPNKTDDGKPGETRPGRVVWGRGVLAWARFG